MPWVYQLPDLIEFEGKQWQRVMNFSFILGCGMPWDYATDLTLHHPGCTCDHAGLETLFLDETMQLRITCTTKRTFLQHELMAIEQRAAH